MLSFHSEQRLKISLLKKLTDHAKNNDFIADYRTKEADSTQGHPIDLSIAAFGGNYEIARAYEIMFGIPEVLVGVFRGIFNGLHEHQQKWWAIISVQNIPVGKDLSGIWPVYAEKLLIDDRIGVEKVPDKFRELPTDSLSLLVRAIKNKSLVKDVEWTEISTKVNAAVNYATYKCKDIEKDSIGVLSNILYCAHAIHTSNVHAKGNPLASDMHASIASDNARAAVYCAAKARSASTNICRQTELQALALIDLLETHDYG